MEAFFRLDTDGSGSLNHAEIRAALKSQNTDLPYEIIDEIIRDVDRDGDGKIDLGEFATLVRATKGSK